ncbi:MAG: hypothetical protein IJ147_13500 [Lachnospiraceae bacterium]|nr:hypothetical protein [Lachnospiraceae bacterium]
MRIPNRTTMRIPKRTTTRIPSRTTTRIPKRTTTRIPKRTTTRTPSRTTTRIPKRTTTKIPSRMSSRFWIWRTTKRMTGSRSFDKTCSAIPLRPAARALSAKTCLAHYVLHTTTYRAARALRAKGTLSCSLC